MAQLARERNLLTKLRMHAEGASHRQAPLFPSLRFIGKGNLTQTSLTQPCPS